MTSKQLYELKRIVEKLIPIGNDDSLCHVGICSINRCARCQDAFMIRKLIDELEIQGS